MFRKHDEEGTLLTAAKFGKAVQTNQGMRGRRDHYIPLIATKRREKSATNRHVFSNRDFSGIEKPLAALDQYKRAAVSYEVEEAIVELIVLAGRTPWQTA